MQGKLSLRDQSALHLLAAELFLKKSTVSDEDRGLVQDGISLSWRWVSGQEVDAWEICNYIDGEINLPIRSTLYEPGSAEDDALSAAFLSVGLVALYCCQESGRSPSSSIENYGDNEADVLDEMLKRLSPDEKSYLHDVKSYLDTRGGEKTSEFGLPVDRAKLPVQR